MHAKLRHSNSHLAEIRHTQTNPVDSDKAGCATIQGTTLTYTGSTYSMGLKPTARMWPTSLYYAAHGHICKLNMYYKNYTIILMVKYTTYCYFSMYNPQTSPQ